MAAQQQQTPLQYVLWLGVALLAHVMVALFGVMNRFLQASWARVWKRPLCDGPRRGYG